MERRKVRLVNTFTGFAPFQALACLVGEWGREYLALRFLASVWERPMAEVRE